MFTIKRIRFENFRLFRSFEMVVNERINIFVGDNGAGKSSILQGIELALCGSATRVRNIGLENLINADAVSECLEKKDINALPQLIIEVYLSSSEPNLPSDERFFGEKNHCNEEYFGVKLVCEPIEEYMNDIKSSIDQSDVFPYELYRIEYRTFKDENFNSYRKPLKTIFVDSSEMNSKYLLKKTIKETYLSAVTDAERRKNSQKFKALLQSFEFVNKSGIEDLCVFSQLEDNLEIRRSGVFIENFGKGEINIIKINYALGHADDSTEIIFLEEPENHLTHVRMRKLIGGIESISNAHQIFIVTHSSKIVSGLGLNYVFFIARNLKPVSLAKLSPETSRFFIKAPSDNLLQFILLQKVILVEGAAEYILMDLFYERVAGCRPEKDDVWIISVNGLSFARYLEIAKELNMRVAVLRDNDGAVVDRYSEYCGDAIKVFSDPDASRYTFEKCIYDDNKDICDDLFNNLDWMLKNKAEAAYKLLLKVSLNNSQFVIPKYIEDAILWIRK